MSFAEYIRSDTSLIFLWRSDWLDYSISTHQTKIAARIFRNNDLTHLSMAQSANLCSHLDHIMLLWANAWCAAVRMTWHFLNVCFLYRRQSYPTCQQCMRFQDHSAIQFTTLLLWTTLYKVSSRCVNHLMLSLAGRCMKLPVESTATPIRLYWPFNILVSNMFVSLVNSLHSNSLWINLNSSWKELH